MTGPMNKDFYYGCIGEVGHYWYKQSSHGITAIRHDHYPKLPFGYGGPERMCFTKSIYRVTGDQKEGYAILHHDAGRTFLAFWDQSADHRPNSVSVFMTTLDQKNYIEYFKNIWPTIWNRYKFPIHILQTICHHGELIT